MHGLYINYTSITFYPAIIPIFFLVYVWTLIFTVTYNVQVLEFLEDFSASLSELANRELNMLKEIKVTVHFLKYAFMMLFLNFISYGCYGKQRKEEGESPFGIEDLLYYVKRIEERQFDMDFKSVKQYFPVSLVLSGIFKIFQDLFGKLLFIFPLHSHSLFWNILLMNNLPGILCRIGLRFEEIEDAEVWHSDVRAFTVFDLSSNELLGYFYLDIYMRCVTTHLSCLSVSILTVLWLYDLTNAAQYCPHGQRRQIWSSLCDFPPEWCSILQRSTAGNKL